MDGSFKESVRIDPKIGTFLFSCSGSGSCCRGEIDIRLNLYDLQRMAGFLDLENTGGLFEQYYVRKIPLKEGGFRPAIQFKEKPIRFCPFLENRLEDCGSLKGICRLHETGKPLVCFMAPVGREVVFNEIDLSKHQETWYVTEPVEGCEGCQAQMEQCMEKWIQPFAYALEREVRYFRVLDWMQRRSDSAALFQSFHYELKTNECIDAYLKHWETLVLEDL